MVWYPCMVARSRSVSGGREVRKVLALVPEHLHDVGGDPHSRAVAAVQIHSDGLLLPCHPARRAELEKAHAEILAQAQEKASKLEGLLLQITQKAGVDGRLFGSVTNADIAQELSKQGLAVLKSQIRMPNGPLKIVGDHPVSVALHTDVTVDVTVTVYGETA